jgi:hypothetical protein
MKVQDFGGTHSVRFIAELEELLQARFKDQLNEFSLCADSSDYPLLWIFVKGDLVAIYYIPADGQAGYVSIGGQMNLDPKKMTTFQIGGFDPGDTIDVHNEFIVPFSEALKVAKEFFHSQELPRSIKWFEL